MEILKYIRKPFIIEAVPVVEENMEEVAEWCDGKVLPRGEVNPNSYVKVPVYRPLSVRQSQAFPGDWVIKTDKGYKVYSDAAFHNTFDEMDPEVPDGLGGTVRLGPKEEFDVLMKTEEFVEERPARQALLEHEQEIVDRMNKNGEGVI